MKMPIESSMIEIKKIFAEKRKHYFDYRSKKNLDLIAKSIYFFSNRII